MKTFVLSIPRLKDRLEGFKASWQGLDYEIFNGLDCQDFPNVVPFKNPLNKRQAYLRTNTFASLSAFQMLEYAVNTNEEWFWFMEDDARRNAPIPTILNLIEEAKGFEWDVLKLFSEEAARTLQTFKDPTYTLVKPKNFVSTVSWVCNRKTLEKIIIDPSIASIDYYIWGVVNNVAIKPNLVYC